MTSYQQKFQSVSPKNTQTAQEIETLLKVAVFGQNAALKKVAEKMQGDAASCAVITGEGSIGKSYTACKAAEVSGRTLVRCQVADMREDFDLLKVNGTPPGYFSPKNEQSLAKKLRENPHAVLLLDEIDKAHPRVFNVLLCALRDQAIELLVEGASYTDKKGNRHFNAESVPLGNVKAFITTNLDEKQFQTLVKKNCGQDAESILKFLEKSEAFTPLVKLEEESLALMVGVQIAKFNDRLQKIPEYAHIRIETSAKFCADIATFAHQNGGSRRIARAIEDYIIIPLVDYLEDPLLAKKGEGTTTVYINDLSKHLLLTQPPQAAVQQKPFKGW